MMPNQKIRLLHGNRLIGGHVYCAGDVVEVSGDRVKEFLAAKAGVLEANESVTVPPRPRLRSEIIAERAENPAPGRAERAVKQPVRPA
jgi:hypothetical protein